MNTAKIYGLIGKTLCGIAGGIVGFMTYGVLATFIGAISGVLVGYILEKVLVSPVLTKN
jgi:outer membrane lipoprotein SlyB